MVGVTERCEIQAGSGDEAVEQAGRYGIGLSRDFASAVSRLRVRLAAAAFRCGGLGGEAGARAWTADAGGAAGVGPGGEGRAPGPGDTTWSCGCCRWGSSILTAMSWPAGRRAAPAAPAGLTGLGGLSDPGGARRPLSPQGLDGAAIAS